MRVNILLVNLRVSRLNIQNYNMRYFLAPRSGEKSYSNFQSTIKHGVPMDRIEPYLSEEGKLILAKEEVIYAWGNREGKKGDWMKMQLGDMVLFYAHSFLVMAGTLVFKQHNPELALAMWPRDDKGNPWEYTFFIRDLKYFKIPITYFNLVSGYKFRSVQGFQEITTPYRNQILTKYKSFDEMFKEFKDEGSAEIPKLTEPVNINLKIDVEAEFDPNFRLKPYVNIVSSSASVPKSKQPIDFEERHRKNTFTGDKGEILVMKNEKKYLIKHGRKDLADKVKRVSLDDMAAGYDVLSFDTAGNEKKIEVKSTTLPYRKYFSFRISAHEKKISDMTANYYLYLVFSVNSLKPKIVAIKNPFVSKEYLHIEPTQFLIKGQCY